MAVWLAEQVGPKGRVVATDLNTTYLQRIELPNLEVLEHNISTTRSRRCARVRSTWCVPA